MTFRSKVQFSALALLVAAVLASGCGSSSESPTAPSGLNLAGTWAGNLGSNSNDRNTVTWTATQSGTSPTGAFGITLDEGDALLARVGSAVQARAACGGTGFATAPLAARRFVTTITEETA